MKIGYCPGVFDLLHHGHINLILKSKELCDKLIIGVHTDKFVEEYKRKPTQNTKERMQNLIKNNLAKEDEIVEVGNIHLEIIKKYNVKYIFHGSDWELESYKKQIRYYEDNLDKMGVEIKIIEYSKGISSTNIINDKLKFNLNNKNVYIFDLDKTLVIGDKPMLFSDNLIDNLNKNKKNIYLVTNNNYYTIDNIKKILDKNNINIKKENIYTPLKNIKKYLFNNRYKNISLWSSKNIYSYFENDFNIVDHESSDIIIVAYNNDFSYNDLSNLLTNIKNKDYIITNIDLTYPDQKIIYPDTGITYDIIKKLTKKEPLVKFGKPNLNIINDILEKYNKNEIVFIGDSLKTDKILAEKANIDFIRIADDGDISNLGIIIDYLKYN